MGVCIDETRKHGYVIAAQVNDVVGTGGGWRGLRRVVTFVNALDEAVGGVDEDIAVREEVEGFGVKEGGGKEDFCTFCLCHRHVEWRSDVGAMTV